jgi:hypothetical protein
MDGLISSVWPSNVRVRDWRRRRAVVLAAVDESNKEEVDVREMQMCPEMEYAELVKMVSQLQQRLRMRRTMDQVRHTCAVSRARERYR